MLHTCYKYYKYTCYNNPQNLSIIKSNEQTACGFSLFTHCSLIAIKIYMINIEVQTAWKTFIKIYETCNISN